MIHPTRFPSPKSLLRIVRRSTADCGLTGLTARKVKAV
jgi:hypothetical protein